MNSENEPFAAWSRIKETLQTLYLGDNDVVDISQNAFTYYERLTWLNMDANKLSAVSSHHLPASLRTLSYSHNYVQHFPGDLLENLADLTRLYVRGNYVRQLPLHTLRQPKRMDKLDLGENLIELAEGNGSLQHVLTIRDLHLDFNRIRKLPARCFKGASVARLYLGRNRLQYVDEKAFADLGNSLEYLDMEHNNLDEIPVALGALKRLKYLYVSSNSITNVSAEVFETLCPNLKAVSFSGNQLTRVPSDALQSCDMLSHLNLGYNYLREISEQDFAVWSRSLDTLLLRNNRISEIAAHTFRSSPKLRELSLSFNKISSIHERAFVDLKSSLESLEISFGLFQEELTGDFLRPLNYLLWLSLDNNNVNAVAPSAFHSLHNLQYLNLDTNAISDLPTGLLSAHAHKRLRDVRLSGNYLYTLRMHSFADLDDLQNVIICRNQLREIENNSFFNLPSIANVLLSGNRISKIDASAFVNLPNLAKLDLQQNELSSLNLNAFVNVSSTEQSLSLNLSRNELREIEADLANFSPLYLHHVDISINSLANVPRTLLELCSGSIKKLDLARNRISKLNEAAFRNLTTLQSLSLASNRVYFVHKRAFVHLPSLQILDLSGNRIEYFSGETFSSTKNLRILNLSVNNLRSLPRDLLSNTIVESLDLSSNLLNVMPGSSISEIGQTLRRLDLSNNHIEHLDSTMFADVPTLTFLNLSNNKLNILPDNVFTSIGNLLTLDISANPLRANFKELFHYVQKLRNLNLAETGLSEVPHLPLPNLVTLRLSRNRIEKLSSASVDNLVQLRRLYLDNNRFKSLPSNVWSHLPLLKELDVSNNPIKVSENDIFLVTKSRWALFWGEMKENKG